MNFTTYKYFSAIAHADSVKQAADTLMISPQALSEHVRKVEQELGTELLTHTRPAQLTPCGIRFLRYAESMLYERYRLEKDLRELSDRQREIVLSVSVGDYPPFLTEALAAFSARYPNCLITIRERPNPVSAAALRSYDLNLSSESLSRGMTEVLIQGSDFQRKSEDAVSTNSLAVLVCRRLLMCVWGTEYENNLGKFGRNPDLNLFQRVPFIRFTDFGNDSFIDSLFEENGFLPLVAAKSDNSEMCIDLCLAGVGAMLVPDGWALRKLGTRTDSGEMELFRLKELHPLLNTYISYRQDKVLAPEEQALISILKECVEKL